MSLFWDKQFKRNQQLCPVYAVKGGLCRGVQKMENSLLRNIDFLFEIAEAFLKQSVKGWKVFLKGQVIWNFKSIWGRNQAHSAEHEK